MVNHEVPTAYIFNMDLHNKPGRHWIAFWTRGNVCEILDSYALPLLEYKTTDPLKEWLDCH